VLREVLHCFGYSRLLIRKRVKSTYRIWSTLEPLADGRANPQRARTDASSKNLWLDAINQASPNGNRCIFDDKDPMSLAPPTASLKIPPLSAGLMQSGRPLRAKSAKPLMPSSRNRPRHKVTVCSVVPKRLATRTLSAPVAHSRMRHARKTIRRPCGRRSGGPLLHVASPIYLRSAPEAP
jgi:hypothetical protein